MKNWKRRDKIGQQHECLQCHAQAQEMWYAPAHNMLCHNYTHSHYVSVQLSAVANRQDSPPTKSHDVINSPLKEIISGRQVTVVLKQNHGMHNLIGLTGIQLINISHEPITNAHLQATCDGHTIHDDNDALEVYV